MEKSLNYKGFMGDIPLDLLYTCWDGLWGAEIGGYRFQIGIMAIIGGIVNELAPFDVAMSRHPKANVINLLECLEDGYWVMWGSYATPQRSIEALKGLLKYKEQK